MGWFLYVLKSISRPDKIYLGSTDNTERRLKDHNRGNTKSTKHFIPWELAYIEEYLTKEEARSRERQLKKWKSRKRVENLISKNNKRP
jgi:putative endonuclease